MKTFTIVLFTFTTIQLSAQPGQPDPTFAGTGTALGPFTSALNLNFSISIQQDGKLVAAGYQVVNGNENMHVIRYNSNGTFDANFGNNGVIEDSVGNANDAAFAVTVQADGKIVVAGAFENPINRDIFIKRYDSTGVVDTTFGLAGISITDFQNNNDDIPLDIAIQSDGKIVLCGVTFNGSNNDIILLRFNVDGDIDSTFGNGGKVSTDIAGTNDRGNSMVLQTDGRILVGGSTESLSSGVDFIVARYKTDGVPDSSFNSDGVFLLDISQIDDLGYSLVLQPDGKIIGGGVTNTLAGDEDDLLFRLDSAGNLDTTFNATGILIKDYNGSDNRINDVMIQSDGKIITAGYVFTVDYDISLSRYNTDGTDDVSFGTLSHISHEIGIENDNVYSALLQSDDKLIVTGSYTDSGLENIFTSRYMNDSLQNFITSVFENEILLYPQPASNEIRISDYPQHSTYSISDMNGRLICSDKEVTSNINISNLEPGIYFLQLNSNSGNMVKMFIKLNN